MADWKQIPDTDVDPDAPVTSELMYALRDNPVALAEGAAGAPRIHPEAMLSSGFLGAASSISTTKYLTILSVGRLSEVVISGQMSRLLAGSQPGLQISFSTNNGGSWGGFLVIPSLESAGDTGPLYFTVNLNLITGNVGGFYGRLRVAGPSVAVPSGVNAFRLMVNETGSGNTASCAVWATGGRDDV